MYIPRVYELAYIRAASAINIIIRSEPAQQMLIAAAKQKERLNVMEETHQ